MKSQERQMRRFKKIFENKSQLMKSQRQSVRNEMLYTRKKLNSISPPISRFIDAEYFIGMENDQPVLEMVEHKNTHQKRSSTESYKLPPLRKGKFVNKDIQAQYEKITRIFGNKGRQCY